MRSDSPFSAEICCNKTVRYEKKDAPSQGCTALLTLVQNYKNHSENVNVGLFLCYWESKKTNFNLGSVRKPIIWYRDMNCLVVGTRVSRNCARNWDRCYTYWLLNPTTTRDVTTDGAQQQTDKTGTLIPNPCSHFRDFPASTLYFPLQDCSATLVQQALTMNTIMYQII